MLVLDTNVILELIKTEPNSSVLKWSFDQDRTRFGTTSICKAELLYGVAIAPVGKYAAGLRQAIGQILEVATGNRVLPFDSESAGIFARLRAHRRAIGRPLKEFDGQIGAICLQHAATLVTRDISDFEHLGLALINPWTD